MKRLVVFTFLVAIGLVSALLFHRVVLDSSAQPLAGVDAQAPDVSGAPLISSEGEAVLQRRDIAPSESMVLHVVDVRDASPVPGARVRVAAVSGVVAGEQWQTSDRMGRVTVDPMPEARVWVTCGGYVPTAVRVAAVGDEFVVGLEPSGSVMVRFTDARGEPVAGVAARLLVPVAEGPEWGFDWYQGSGLAAWTFDRDLLERKLAIDTQAEEMWADRETVEPYASDAQVDWRLVADNFRDPVQLGAGREVQPKFRPLAERLSLEQVSDARGVVQWSGLPAGTCYRWGLCSPLHARMDPAHENVPLAGTDRGVRVGEDPVPLLSGQFAVVAEELAEFEVSVEGSASVSGSFALAAGAGRAQVKLYDLQAVQSERGLFVDSYSQEAFGVSDASGRFRFENVRPGAKLLRAYWHQKEQDFYFATHVLMLAPGEQHDTGMLACAQGNTLSCELELRDRDGREVDAQQWFGRPGMHGVVVVDAFAGDGGISASVYEMVGIRLGTSFRLHGLPAGEVAIRATPEPGWEVPQSKGRIQVHDQEVIHLALPHTQEVKLALRVDRLVQRRFRVRYPAGGNLPVVQLFLKSDSSSEVQSLRVKAPRSASVHEQVVDLWVHPEQHRLLMHSVSGTTGDGQSGASLFGQAEVDFRHSKPGRDPVIELQTAASVRGRFVDQDGMPQGGRMLQFSPPEWLDESGRSWIYRCRTANDGSFELGGLPPGASLVGYRPGTDFSAAGAGSVAEVYLIGQGRRAR
ncbi:MAG: hypothetical protein VYE77_07620 [Planctomycetota bacterium]|nr:hypothetical protein [Planctomycetota bacterium]